MLSCICLYSAQHGEASISKNGVALPSSAQRNSASGRFKIIWCNHRLHLIWLNCHDAYRSRSTLSQSRASEVMPPASSLDSETRTHLQSVRWPGKIPLE